MKKPFVTLTELETADELAEKYAAKRNQISLTFKRETKLASNEITEPILLFKVIHAARAKGLPLNEKQIVNFVSLKELGVFIFQVRNSAIDKLVLWVVRA